MSIKAVIWGILPIFLIHDLEEILTMPGFWEMNKDRLPVPNWVRRRVEINVRQVIFAVMYEFLILVAITTAAARALRPGKALQAFSAALSILFFNVLTHLGQSLLIGRYTPGVITAPIVGLPYTLYAFFRLRKAGLVTWRSMGRAAALGVIIALPLVLSAHLIGNLLAGPTAPVNAAQNPSRNPPHSARSANQ